MMNNLDQITEQVRGRFEEIDGVREKAYKQSREIIRLCATAIRSVHRSEWDAAQELIDQVEAQVKEMVADTSKFPQIYWAGYTQDCLKEYVEAELTYAMIRERPLKGPAELNVDSAAWINGLAEASTELRRRILDEIRHENNDEAERLLSIMNDVYSILVTLDFRDAITGGLRRRTDTVRAVLERTRGDVTTSLRQTQLEKALAAMEQRLRKS